jgi:PleD family two-component response regulator
MIVLSEDMITASETRLATPTTRVLVAEDHARTRESLLALVKHHGYEATGVADGVAALNTIIGSDPPDIALVDWEMPRMDGLRLCQAVRALHAPSYVYMILVTARDTPEDVIAGLDAGADDFLTKPVDAAQLLARMRSGERVLALEHRLERRITELEESQEKVRKLKRLLPICMYCKKIRDDGEYWREIEAYIHDQTGTDFSHGICPNCMPKAMEGIES